MTDDEYAQREMRIQAHTGHAGWKSTYNAVYQYIPKRAPVEPTDAEVEAARLTRAKVDAVYKAAVAGYRSALQAVADESAVYGADPVYHEYLTDMGLTGDYARMRAELAGTP